MPTSEVVRLMRIFKREIAGAGSAQQAEMARRWLAVERRLMGHIDALALQMTAIHDAGGTVSLYLLATNVRYQELLIQLHEEQAKYTVYAERTISNGQQAMAQAGISQSQAAIAAQVSTSFNRLPVSAVEHMVGLTGAGTPLNSLLVQSWPLSAQGLTQALVEGVALGVNPRKVARNMAQGMTGSLNRMMTIARTEQLRVYNEASRQSYIESGIVTSYTRIAAHDSRTCLNCILLEGTKYATDELWPSHPNCRCALIPIVRGAPEPQWQRGEEWFRSQDSATQESIMGKGLYEGWRLGKFELANTVQIVPNAVWGDTLRSVPLRELI
jgi:SPP1 gp7 family putative phage head morphogenesis protein